MMALQYNLKKTCTLHCAIGIVQLYIELQLQTKPIILLAHCVTFRVMFLIGEKYKK